MSIKRKSEDNSQLGKKSKREDDDEYTQGSFEDDLILMATISEESQSQNDSQRGVDGEKQVKIKDKLWKVNNTQE